MNFYKVAFIALFIIICGCDAATKASFEQTYELWVLSKRNPEYLDHLNVIADHNNQSQLDEKNGCYSKEGGVVEMVLIHDVSGVVISAVSKFRTPKSECFLELFMGRQFPAPPYSPYYEYVLFK